MAAPALRQLATAFLGLTLVIATTGVAQARLTTPQEALGFRPGDDYQLASYTQLTEWWKQLDVQSDRMKLVSIGKTAEGRDQWTAIITSPANHAKLDRYQEISARLSRAEGLTPEQARALAKEGKAVVWIDGGLHATEVLGATQLMEHVWQMVSQNDEETLRILDDVVQLVTHANPDGMELVSGWYMRTSDPTKRSTGGLPRLYQKYVGHDNNRDFYLNAMPESENMSRMMYREWYPQIMYNHHQTGPAGAVLFVPPFRDPHNHNLDPLLVNGISLVGAAMHSRLAAEGKGGAVMRNGASYQTWWNGGLRTAAYFHNQIGILTETIGSPTPMQIPFVPSRQLSTGDLPFPIEPQPWHFRQSVEYSMTNNRAILDLASRYRETMLYNGYQMGRNSIERGSKDSWINTPAEIDAVTEAAARARSASGQGAAGGGQGPGGGGVDQSLYDKMLRNPLDRSPRGYILRSDQADFPNATAFINALLKSGIDVHRATAAFGVAGKQYPAGSWVVQSAQAFRPHVLDMFEPQNYPNDIPYPGGPPRAPYDNAGYTLALQMGVEFDRVLEGFSGPFEKVTSSLVTAPSVALGRGKGYLIGRQVNEGFLAVNRLLAAGQPVREISSPLTSGGTTWSAGTWYVPASAKATEILKSMASGRGLPAVATASGTPAGSKPAKPLRVGLWDQYGGSMPSGWTRWILEQFEFPFTVVFPPRLDAGDLRKDFDVLVFVDGAIPGGAGGTGGGGGGFGQAPSAESIPAEFRTQLGRVTVDKTVPQLKAFLEAGGSVVTIGSSTALATHLGLPVASQLVEPGSNRPLSTEKFYIPASLLEVAVDHSTPATLGMGDRAIVLFDGSPVFKLGAGAEAAGIKVLARFDSPAPLRSGWAWGQGVLNGGVAAALAPVGKGTLYLYGPEVTFRAQPSGTFRLLFNTLIGR